jgi:hypothetical protein
MATTETVDPTDRGLPPAWGDPTAYGDARVPNQWQRAAYIEQAAADHGWAGDVASRERRRRALANPCPRSTCRAPETVGCRAVIRGRRRPISGLHAEREQLLDE